LKLPASLVIVLDALDSEIREEKHAN